MGAAGLNSTRQPPDELLQTKKEDDDVPPPCCVEKLLLLKNERACHPFTLCSTRKKKQTHVRLVIEHISGCVSLSYYDTTQGQGYMASPSVN